jgi:hypothetical protein
MSALEESRWPSRLRGTLAFVREFKGACGAPGCAEAPPYNGSVRLRETVAALPKEQN